MWKVSVDEAINSLYFDEIILAEEISPFVDQIVQVVDGEMRQVSHECLEFWIGTLRCVETFFAADIDDNGRYAIKETTNNSHQEFFRCRFIELVAETKRDGRESDVAIQIISVDGDNCRIIQVASPEDCRVEAREEHERDDCEAPKSAENSNVSWKGN